MTTEIFVKAGMLAPDGRCKTFDAAADGYVRGEGCGMVVLKRLSEAEAAGDRIWAVVRGSAVNQDGASAGLTVPSGPAQERVIGEALRRAGLDPSEVDYLEAHGTGTELGDPVEAHAAAAAYGRGRALERPLLIGSVKTNVGHLESAAGIVGLVKVVLAMRHGVIPKHLHYETPNPRMDWERLPLRVTSEATLWPELGRPVRAGVSSFGFSGTNAHVVLESHGVPGEGGVGAGAARPVEVATGPATGVYSLRGRPTGAAHLVGAWRAEGEGSPAADAPAPAGTRLPAGHANASDTIGNGSRAQSIQGEDSPVALTAPEARDIKPRVCRVLALSARTDAALRGLAARYLAWLDEQAGEGGQSGEGRRVGQYGQPGEDGQAEPAGDDAEQAARDGQAGATSGLDDTTATSPSRVSPNAPLHTPLSTSTSPVGDGAEQAGRDGLSGDGGQAEQDGQSRPTGAASGMDALLADMAWTAGVGRSRFEHRAGVVFGGVEELRGGLERLAAEGGRGAGGAVRVAFLFTGQGSQWAGMGRELYRREPVVRAVLERCEREMVSLRGESLLDVMFGREGAAGRLDDTTWTQPALYALGCALSALWESVGVRPVAVLGHSVGELAAAHVAGVYGLEEGLRLASVRGELMGSLPSDAGAMTAVFASAERVDALIEESGAEGVEVAADNGTHRVVSGLVAGVEALEGWCGDAGVRCGRLVTSHAFHSGLMEPVLDGIEAAAGDIEVSAPVVSLVSNVTGRVVGEGELLDGAYWRRHARAPVAYGPGVGALSGVGVDVVIELGPGSVLGPLLAQVWPGDDVPVVLTSQRRALASGHRDAASVDESAEGPGAAVSGGEGAAASSAEGDGFVEAVAGAWEAGLGLRFEGLHAGELRRRLSLPTYPFERHRYWVEGVRRQRAVGGHPLLGKRHDLPGGGITFEREMSALDPSWLGDHRVFGRIVAPAALHAALATTAIAKAAGTVRVAFEEFQIHAPLVFDDADDAQPDHGRRTLQVVLGPSGEDGVRSVEIHSRGEEDDSWLLHGEGRVATYGEVTGEDIEVETLKADLAPTPGTAFYDAMTNSGIGYGPLFRVMESTWLGSGEALAELVLPPALEADDVWAHPALLDGCFQALALAASEEPGSDETWLPFGWERLWLAGPLPERVLCRVRIAESGPEAESDVVTAALRFHLGFHSEDGACIGGVQGLVLKRATRAALMSAAAGVGDLLYDVAWRERALSGGFRPADFLAPPDAVARRAGDVAMYLGSEGIETGAAEGFLADIEQLARSHALAALEGLGWEREAGTVVRPGELRRPLRVVAEHERLLHRLFGMLAEAGILEPSPEGLVVAAGERGAVRTLSDPAMLLEDLLERHSAGAAELRLLERCGAALADVLRGRAEPSELLFGEGVAGAAELYREMPLMRAMQRLAGGAVEALAEAVPEERRLRVLEIGAGGGTETIRAGLPEGRFDYLYAESPALSSGARAASSSTHRVLDVERDPVAQGFEAHGYDVVVAANVLHATRDLGEALSHCRALLAPSGTLVALEGLRRQGWLDLTFGLLDGWWRYADEYRIDGVLVGETVWRRALSDAGYGEVAVLSSGADATQGVIVARGPAEVTEPEGLWLVASGRGDTGRRLAGALAARNQRVVLAGEGVSWSGGDELPGVTVAHVDPGRREAWRSLAEELGGDGKLRGVVHLAAVNGRGEETGPDDLPGDDAADRYAGALALTQGLLDGDVSPSAGVWLVTRGAQQIVHERGGELAGAVLWGLGRTVALEAPQLGVRLVDLDPDVEPDVGVLAGELLHPDRETQVAHRAGVRHAARLVRGVAADAPALPEPAAGRLRGDGTYLVTGGLGGIGREVAAWLAERGAGAIVLNARRAPGPETEAELEALRKRGVTVEVELADVSDGEAVEAMLARIGERLPPLAGVIHGAGVLADGALGNQDRERFERVMAPKILGAWHLHRATRDLALDLFMLFTSAAGVFGNPGQANYAAANAFLDRLARHRRSAGLAGQAIAWGAWSGAGMAEGERARVAERLQVIGQGWLSPAQGVRALDRLTGQGAATAVVTVMDWPALAGRLGDAPPFLEEVLPAVADRARDAGAADLLSRLRRTPAAEREAVLVRFLQDELQSVLRLPRPPAPTVGFFDLGMDSLMAVELRSRLNDALSGAYTVPGTLVFDYPDIERLARHLAGELGMIEEPPASAPIRAPAPSSDEPVAIVGMACRFPGGADLAAFWDQLAAGRDAIAPVREGRSRPDDQPEVELVTADSDTPSARTPSARWWGAYIDDIDQFDPSFFRIAPVEARLLDPQQRLLLETSWEALEEAGIDPVGLRGSRAGVFVGVSTNDYREHLSPNEQDEMVTLYTATGNSHSSAIGRVAFTLGLEGPAFAVDTACSSSLVALHQAVSALQRGETDLALAGGVNAILAPGITAVFASAGMLAPDGRCKTFDAAADGYVRGEGCAMVVLKRLSEAEAAGDRIWAVVRGSAVNQDGASAGLTVPSGPAQERVIGEALSRAGLEPSEVDYLEAHGTGTELGDPVEAHAAGAAYGRGRAADRPLLIGSVKTNVGHLESAAGVAGLVKVLLAMHHGVIPMHLHFETPSPRMDWARLPLQVVSEATPWPTVADRPRRAGLSSFGYSGTNVHVILESRGLPGEGGVGAGAARTVGVVTEGHSLRRSSEGEGSPATRAPAPVEARLSEGEDGPSDVTLGEPAFEPRVRRMLALSARSDVALRAQATRYLAWIGGQVGQAGENGRAGADGQVEQSGAAGQTGDDAGRAGQDGQSGPVGAASGMDALLADMAWTAGVGRSRFEHRAGVVFGGVEELRGGLERLASEGGRGAGSATRVAFLFTGQGSQWAGMGQELYRHEPVVRAVLERCEREMVSLRGESLLDVMFGVEGAVGSVDDTTWTQPALYALGCALSALWESVGVRPVAVLGHSVGELAAAHVAGVFGLEEGLRLASVRGELMGSLPSDAGAMTAVFASAERVEGLIEESGAEGVEVAADNGTHRVVSGLVEGVEALEGWCIKVGVRCGRLVTSHAFHSALMEPVLDGIEAAAGGIEVSAPVVSLVSNVTGRVVGEGELLDGAYWRRHARAPVAYGPGVGALSGVGVDVVIELGPGAVLGPLLEQTWPGGDVPVVLTSQRRGSASGHRAAESAEGPGAAVSGGARAAVTGGEGDGFVEAVAGAWEAGLGLRFEGLHAGEARRRLSLPTYPFERRRYWVEGSGRRPRVAGGHPLLGLRRDSAGGEVTWETELSAPVPAWLGEHRVFGRMVVPASAHGALMHAAAESVSGAGAVVVEAVRLHAPLVVLDETAETARRTVQVVVGAAEESAPRMVKVYSKGGGDKGWMLHAEGRAVAGLGEAEDEEGVGIADVGGLKSGLEPMPAESFYEGLSEVGIEPGPGLRVVESVWSGGGESVVEVVVPGSSGTGDAPARGRGVSAAAVLGGCFQALSVVSGESGAGEVWLGSGWERLWLVEPLPERVLCHARLRGAEGESASDMRVADVGLHSVDGRPVGGVRGVELTCTTRAALLSASSGMENLLYDVVWRERARPGGVRPADFLVAPAAVAERATDILAYLEADGIEVGAVVDFLHDIEHLSRGFALAVLDGLGWRREPGAQVHPGELRRPLKVVAEYEPLLYRLFGLLEEAGILDRSPDGLVVAEGGQEDDRALSDPAGFLEELRERHPFGAVELGLLGHCGAALGDVLRGRADPLEVLFGDGYSGAADLYREAPMMRAMNRVVRDTVEALAGALPEGRRLRVLEVGAGTGGTTGSVLAALPTGCFDYVYTDISAGFFAAARERFDRDGVSLDYRVLDIERDPVAQGFETHGFDLLIAANVLHAARDLGEALEHCRALLAPSGTLVALEGLRRQSWLDLTFGFLEGWWRFEDEYRTEGALVSGPVWRRALSDAGYGEVAVLSRDADAPQGVIVARGPTEVAESPGLWVVASDRGNAGRRLAEGLAARNQRVVLAGEDVSWPGADGMPGVKVAHVASGRREAWRSLVEELAGDEALRGVVHLAGLDGDGEEATADGLAGDVEHGCASALALTQGLLDGEVAPSAGVWFVTRGAQRVERERDGALAGAALWGLGRAVGVEAPQLGVRLVDLDPEDERDDRALVEELLYPDREPQVAHRSGVRHAARLTRGVAPAAPAAPERPVGRVRSDRTYLVTGGLGGIGCEVAVWLGDLGAGTIVLNGHREPEPEAEAVMDGLRERGVAVAVEIVDVSDGEAVEAMLSRIGEHLPPLAGVIHSVGVLADAALANQDWERFARVLEPKVLGAWHLHRATRGLDLDLFVLFSSVVGVLGNAGQANHAAANAFLDRLAGHRRSLGLAGQAIAWGAWSDTGEAEEQRGRIEERMRIRGQGWLSPVQGIAALDHLVGQGAATALVTVADWSVVANRLERVPPFLEEIVPAAAGVATAAATGLLPRLRQAPAAEREALLVEFLLGEVQAVLGLPEPPAPAVGFFDLGMDSLMAVELRNRLNGALAGAFTLSGTAVLDHPDVESLARHLAGELGMLDEAPAPAPARAPAVAASEPVAIVGMACRFPGGADLAAFWDHLEAGRDAMVAVPGGQGRPDGDGERILFERLSDAPAAHRWGAFIDGVDRFDASFFRIAPVEARFLDPQQRLLLETSWEALEEAGIDPAGLRGSRAGVFAGIGASDYRELLSAGAADPATLYTATGTASSTAIGRIAFTLGLEGPAMAVDTACSSSLVAVSQALASLQRGESDLALAGGVNVILSPMVTEIFVKSRMLAADGRCKTFDAAADGFGRGEGCGMVVLKRLSDAEAAGDRIWAVVRGSAVNQDGASAGLTVPSGPAQERVIAEALSRAGLAPSEVDYLETHGTGTELGDPVEAHAAAAVYGRGRASDRPLLIGTVKTNIGHLEAAAGVAGLVKVVLSMHHGVIPRHLHFETPNPRMDWERLPLRVTSEATPWPAADRPRRAGLSSFGFSGTNVHLVLEGHGVPGEGDPEAGAARPVEARLLEGEDSPARTAARDLEPRVRRVLTLSARSDAALRDQATRYLAWLDRQAGQDGQPGEDGRAGAAGQAGDDAGTAALLADMAWTAGVGRSRFEHRAGVVFGGVEELRGGLERLAAEGGRGAGDAVRVAFLFTGQGSQWAGMGRALYRREPVVRAVLERCEREMVSLRGESLLDVMFGREGAAGRLDDTTWTQPALYALGCALSALWESVGVRPVAVLGHSVGELAAAHVAGVYGLEEGLRLASVRGELMGSLPSDAGAMTAVFASAERVDALIEESGAEGVEVAADNGTHRVVSGLVAGVEALEGWCGDAGVRCGRLVTSHAFHSGLMEPVLDGIEAAAGDIEVSAPVVSLVSNVTGRVVGEGELLDGAYWRRHARAPVAYGPGVGALSGLGVDVVIELGPGSVLGPLLAQVWPGDDVPVVLTSQRRGSASGHRDAASVDESAEGPGAAVSGGEGAAASSAEGDGFVEAVSGAWEAGLGLRFEGLHAGELRRRLSLPTYPFERQRYWVEGVRRRRVAAGHPLLGVRHDSAGGEVTWEAELAAPVPAWLGEHRVFGRMVAPASAHGALMHAAAESVSGAGAVSVETVRLHAPLVIPDEEGGAAERTLQVVVGAAEESAPRMVRVYSRGSGDEEWVLHAEGRTGAGSGEAEDGEGIGVGDVESLKAGLEPMPEGSFYEGLSEAGIEPGPGLRVVKSVWAGAGEAVLEVALPPASEAGEAAAHGRDTPAVVLAGCFQALSAVSGESGMGEVWLASGWERLWLADPLPERLLCHARLRGAEGESASQVRAADLGLFSVDGRPVAGARGVELSRTTRAALLSAVTGVGELLYDVAWRERALSDGSRPADFPAVPAADAPRDAGAARGPSKIDEPAGLWVIAPDRGGVGRRLAEALAAHNQRVVVAGEDAAWLDGDELPGVTVAHVDPGRREAWRSFVGELAQHHERHGLRGVVHLAGLDGSDGGEAAAGELFDDAVQGCASALALTQGLLDAEAALSAGVWFVTRGAQCPAGEHGGVLAGAALWGLARTAALEAPQLGTRLVDLDPDGGQEVDALVDELLHPDRETQVAHRAGVRHAARLARRAAPDDPSEGRLRGDRTYLVTGGLGGLGREVATWLADRGAGAIVLNGRRAPGPEAEATIAALRERGVTVAVEHADISDGDAVDALLSRIDTDLPPLAGVIHAAGVLADGVLANQSRERLERVLAPKVLGAWHLHRATGDLDLDLFVLFSAMAGVLGSAGQASYTAANAFLDRLAHHRRSLGLAGQAVAWGAWSGAGMAESRRDRMAARMRALGQTPLSPAQGLRALDGLVGQDAPAAVVAAMDWPVLARVADSVPPFLDEVLPAVPEDRPRDGAPAPVGLVVRLRKTPAAEREAVLVAWLQGELRAILGLSEPPDPTVGFFDLGMDSLMAVELHNRLDGALSGACTVPRTVVFDHPDARSLARHLLAAPGMPEAETPVTAPTPAAAPAPAPSGDDLVAIVGMACRFPGGENLAAFWDQLEGGRNAVTAGRPESDRKLVPELFEWIDTAPEACRWGGFVDGIDLFDAPFFRITPIEAEVMDPQHRMLLETSWEAIEDAGHDPRGLRGSRTAVYAGIGSDDYAHLIMRGGGDYLGLNVVMGTGASTAPNRIAFQLGLEGVAMPVSTMCSSSLVALHHAVIALQRGEVNLALAGGVNAILAPVATQVLDEVDMLSGSGRCRTFDAAADGYVRGEGCGVVVLKRLADAEADGDRIRGVIRGSAINQNGASAGPAAPNGSAQERVMAEALARAGLGSGDVDYLEAHGTGTRLGDSIEVRATSAVYGGGRNGGRPLLLGTVKTNIGHLEAAAGVAGLIKVLLSMHYGVIPKNLHFETPSPDIDWEALPVRVVTEPTPWPRPDGRPARAGISAFGLSGTNAHVVVEGYGPPADAPDASEGMTPASGDMAPAIGSVSESPPVQGASADATAPQVRSAPGSRATRLLPLSARSERSLRDLAARYLSWLDGHAGGPSSRDVAGEKEPAPWLADMAWTAGVGRSHFGMRAGLPFSDEAELRSKLRALVAAERAPDPGAASRVALVFTGEGGRSVGMGRSLHDGEPVVREVLERCDRTMRELRGASLLDVMFGRSTAGGSLHDAAWTQPALYAMQCAMAKLWASIGIRPVVVLGHGAGELAAAHVAGMYGLEDGLRLAAKRGELMARAAAEGGDAGAMVAVYAARDRVAEAMREAHAGAGGSGPVIAADNGTHQVVGGPADRIEALAERLRADGTRVVRLGAEHAYCVPLAGEALDELEAAFEDITFASPEITVVSGVLGRRLREMEALDGAYWRRHACEPVAFADGVAALAVSGVDVLVETGPGRMLKPVMDFIRRESHEAVKGGSASRDRGETASSPPSAQRRDAPLVLSSMAPATGGAPADASDSVAEGPAAGMTDAEQFVACVARIYEAGLPVTFEGLFAGERRRRTALPTYPFDRTSYWLE